MKQFLQQFGITAVVQRTCTFSFIKQTAVALRFQPMRACWNLMGSLQAPGLCGVSAVPTYDYVLDLQNISNLCTATVSPLHPNKFKTKKKNLISWKGGRELVFKFSHLGKSWVGSEHFLLNSTLISSLQHNYKSSATAPSRKVTYIILQLKIYIFFVNKADFSEELLCMYAWNEAPTLHAGTQWRRQ